MRLTFSRFLFVANTTEVKEDVDPTVAAYRKRLQDYNIKDEGKLCVVSCLSVSYFLTLLLTYRDTGC